jgi:hypothetical protein
MPRLTGIVKNRCRRSDEGQTNSGTEREVCSVAHSNSAIKRAEKNEQLTELRIFLLFWGAELRFDLKPTAELASTRVSDQPVAQQGLQ